MEQLVSDIKELTYERRVKEREQRKLDLHGTSTEL